jgi:hypothetical protein
VNYTVQSGDSPSAIAARFGMTLADLVSANPQKLTMVISGVTTWKSLNPGEILSVPSGVGAAAAEMINALNADKDYCKSVKHPGSAVNLAVHRFKKAWNDANPGAPLPVGTGNYEATVSSALSSIVLVADPTANIPPGCDHLTTLGVGECRLRTAIMEQLTGVGDITQGLPGNTITGPGFNHQGTQATPDSAKVSLMEAAAFTGVSLDPPAVPVPPMGPPSPAQALAAIDPCAQTNSSLVVAFQQSAGLTADGKYGHATATALKKQIASAPAACSPRPAWWGGSGSGGKHRPAPPIPSVPAPPMIPAPPWHHRPAPPMPSPGGPSAAAQALAAVDPCSPTNVGAVWAFQQSIGQDPDGKYGHGTAAALARQVPGAPTACNPRPGWWAPHGQKNFPGAQAQFPAQVQMQAQVAPLPDPPPLPAPTTAPVAQAPVTQDNSAPAPAPAPAPAVTAPPDPPPAPAPGAPGAPKEPKGHRGKKDEISTTALVAAGAGLVAVVGIVVTALSSKKSSGSSDRDETTVRRSPKGATS